MSRLLNRLAALALSSVALGACTSARSDVNQLMGQSKPDSDRAAYDTTLPATLDGEISAAQAQRAQGDYPGAIRILSQLMLAAPDDPRIVGEYGKVLLQQGRTGEAVPFLTRAVQLQPSDWTLYSALGVAYDQTGDAANARVAYDRALSLKPGEAVVLNNYALSRMLAGDLVQAHRLMAQAAAAGAADPKISRNLALLEGLSATPAQSSVSAPAAVAANPPAHGELPAPAAAEPVADHAPKPLHSLVAQTPVQSKTNQPQTIVMQEVPADPKAGPVAKKVKVAAGKHAPHKLAAAPKLRKTAVATKIAASAKTAVKNKIPSLRLADDKP